MSIRQTVSRLAERIAAGRLEGELAAYAKGRDDHQDLVRRLRAVSANVECPHNDSHVLSFILEVFRLPSSVKGVVVEAGCYKGGSTSKISIAAERTGRRLAVFDSFAGLPPNAEDHQTTLGGEDIRGWFEGGAFAGGLDEVKSNVTAHGAVSVCDFIPGWFEDTMPDFTGPIAAAYLDVDLAESTRTCLRYLYPKIQPGGVLMSQDGDFPLVVEVFSDRSFWEDVVGVPMPQIDGLGKSKMLRIRV